jgi:hypothetical protein
MAQNFSASVSAWVKKSEHRIEAVFKASAQDVIAEMQEPGPSVGSPTAFGSGNMPVVTGFLRASLQVAIGGPREGPSGPLKGGTFTYDAGAVALVINAAKLGETIFATYSAAYGPAMEARYGFVRLAAQHWQQIVSKNAREAQNRALG